MRKGEGQIVWKEGMPFFLCYANDVCCYLFDTTKKIKKGK
jgi:hypothetical protein